MRKRTQALAIAFFAACCALLGCSAAQRTSACQEQEWETRVARERLLAARYPDGEYITGLGEGQDYPAAVQAATAALSRKVSVEIESELKDARSFYQKDGRSSYLETLDEVVVSRTAFTYGTFIEADAGDAFPWCGRFVALARAERTSLANAIGRKLAELAERHRIAGQTALTAANEGRAKPFMTGYRDARSLLAEIEVEAAQVRAVSRRTPEELTAARERQVQLEAAGRRLRDSLHPCFEFARSGEVPQEAETLAADSLPRALAGLGLPGTIGGCTDSDGLWVVRTTLAARCEPGAAAAVCTAVATVTISERASDTTLSTFELAGPPQRGLYSEAEAAGASFRKLLADEGLPAQLRAHVVHMIPLQTP